MKICMLPAALACCAAALVQAAEEGLSPLEGLKPGLAFVFFDDEGFQRPGSHGTEKQIKSHGIDEQIDLAIEGIDGFSQLWLGQVRFPVTGQVTFTAEADDGVRLYVGQQCVVDGWAKDAARVGTIEATAGQTLPLRVEYYQSGGPSYLRLYWHWQGQNRQPVPPSAFWHGEKDWQLAQAVAEGKEHVFPGNAPPVVSAPAGDEAFKASIYQTSSKEVSGGDQPIRLRPGPHLFVDDFLIAASRNVSRRVNRPQRDPNIPNPLITGKEDHCVAPYMTVVRDPASGRFRIWYNVYREKFKDGRARFAYLESADGVHWIRPHRVFDDPGPINFGSAVIDEGPDFADLSQRFKLAWWASGGLNIAVSPDGLDWRMLKPYPVLRHNHDINNIFRDEARDRYVATVSVYVTGPKWSGLRRTTMHSTSRDLIHWEKPWYVIAADDSVEQGQTQFYAMNGYLNRGDLLIGLVKVLHDDWQAPGTPEGAFGVGYTTLAWTRDGEHWVRDKEPFFEPDSNVDAWDHAHAWLDFQLPVGQEVFLYYGGYKYGHKMDRWEGRQIGLVKMPRDRYVSRRAGPDGGTLRTATVTLSASKMTVNAAVNGELRVRLLDADGKPIPGFDASSCQPLKGDSLAHTVHWAAPLAKLRERPLQIEFVLRDAQLYGFDLAD